MNRNQVVTCSHFLKITIYFHFCDCVSIAGPPAHEMIRFFGLRIIWLTDRPQNNMLFWFLAEM